jgi:hypothetical protein
MFRLVFLLFVFATPIQAEKIYKIIDGQGNVSYSDQFVEGAQAVNLQNINTMPSLKLPDKPSNKLSEPTQYQQPKVELTILQPAEKQSIRSNNGHLTVVASYQSIPTGIYQLFINDKHVASQSSDQNTITFEQYNLDRGELVIRVTLIDQAGKVLASSPSRTLYLHRASRLFKAH